MANYSVTNSTVFAGSAQNNLSATYASQIVVAASSASGSATPGLRRGKIYDLLVGTINTPADTYVEYEITRATVGTTVVWTGSVSSVSSGYALDMADVGFSAFATMNTTAETNVVVTGQLWYVGVNQRASYRWVAAPGSELVYPAVSSGTGGNGLALKARGSATVPAACTILFTEQ